MAIKHQTESYRNRNGQRFECDGDILEMPIRENAKARVKQLRSEGVKAFYETHDGYCRVFRATQN